ncbi:transposase [Pseudoalteromonas sp. CST5]|uniref:transposase n=1 Tax=unclassified Pseudoalteromonas TaxID=194690 RepID=UPI00235922EF|nr:MULTISPECIES: transposase [unclassified Pseudoalteromonas]MDC9513095.1 transposase [Pseudoalteromonas sp. CST1]MDC9537168.1 transposase [Pseudoalteromonas sp. CST3]MDC9541482.1 transposase [Pseudoalteromonas sp. CST2]MDC9545761.1 transposase [Pseudoalteromonas sp. CST4]MDC9548513.1 transposase [Pseudoalteromonas sp. CST5]
MSKPYSSEFKESVLQKVTIKGRRISDVSNECGIGQSTIYRWLKADNEIKLNSKDRFIQKKLEQRLKEVSDERDILIKAVTIFAKEIC